MIEYSMANRKIAYESVSLITLPTRIFGHRWIRRAHRKHLNLDAEAVAQFLVSSQRPGHAHWNGFGISEGRHGFLKLFVRSLVPYV